MTVRVPRALLLALVAMAALLRPALATDLGAASSPAPAGIAVDGEGNVYVSDYGLDRLVKFGPDGSVLAQWGGSGNGPGQFNAPFGVALEGSTLVVVDQLNNRVQRLAADGSVLSAWGSAGAGASDLRTPFGVAVGGGRIYVADFGNDRVQVFGSDGSLLTTLGGRGKGEGQFLRPAGVAVDHEGTLYVTDHFNDRVQRFSGDGKFQAQIGPLVIVTASSGSSGSAGQAPSAGPAVVSTSAQPPALSAAPPAASAVMAVALPDPRLRRPEGIALDQEGNLWVTDYGHDRVVKLNPDGHLLLSWGSRGSAPGEFVGPKGIAIDPSSGRIYVADTGNARVQRMAPDGTAEAAWSLPSP